MQVAEEIGTEARFQNDFISQLVSIIAWKNYLSWNKWNKLLFLCLQLPELFGGYAKWIIKMFLESKKTKADS